MSSYELSIICESLHLRHKESWEQSRMVSYVIAQSNSKKKLKPTDIITFGWEKPKEETQQPTQLTIEDVEEIKKVALERERILKEKGII